MADLELSKALLKLYHNMMKLEDMKLQSTRTLNLTINELHLIECIRELTKGNDGPTISEVAFKLDITRPSTTVAVNKLVLKKFVEKTGCVSDGRSVRVKLTAKGEKAFETHKKYHSDLAKTVKACFDKEEYKLLSASLQKLDKFFEEKIEEADKEEEF